MTERERLNRTYDVIHQLAQGIDPMTGRELPEDTVLNQVYLSRCFFHAAEVLQGELARLEEPEPRRQRPGFYITDEERAQLMVSGRPVSINEFVRYINECVGDGDREPLHHRTITRWLVARGFLDEVELAGGRRQALVNQQSRMIGITSEPRVGAYGTHEVLLYDREAQGFLLEHLGEMVESTSEDY